MTHLYYAPLFGLLIWAAIEDVRTRQIPGWLTLSLVASGLALSFTRWGALTPLDSTSGLLVGLALGFVLFVVGAWGGGDAKLLAGVGAWLGAAAVLYVLAGALLLGMVVAVTQSLVLGRIRPLLRDSALLGIEMIYRSVPSSALAEDENDVRQVKAATLPLAVPLLLATAGVLVMHFVKGS